MSVLRDLRVRYKILLLLLVPLLGLIYFAIGGILDRSRTAGQMVAIQKLSGLAIAASGLVHEAQKERGMTAGFLGSSGKQFQVELPAQRSATDRKVAELRGFLQGFDAAAYGSQFAGALSGALAKVDQLEGMRRGVSGLSVAAGDAVGHYTALNGAFLDVIAHIANLAADGQVARAITAYISFLRGKEAAGIERATLTNTFARDQFEPGMFNRFSAVVAEQEALNRMFRILASDSAKRYAEEKLRGRAVEEVARMRKVAFERASAGKFEIAPEYWFRAQTEKIDLLKEIEDRLSGELGALAGGLGAGAQRGRLLFIVVAVALVGGALGAATLMARSVTGPLGETLAALRDIAEGDGDLTRRLDATGKDEVAEIAGAFNTFVEKLHSIMRQARAAAEQVAAASRELSAASDQLSSGAQEQASSLEETAASLEEITGTVKQNADNTRQASQLAVGSRAVAEKGGQVVAEAVQSMSEINKSSKKIADIITTIDEIAFQTNLLALNAAVEAARAGEQGRGFAVVASEVRNLAQRSATAAKEIKTLIQDSVQKVGVGSELVNKSGETLSEIVGSVKRVTDIIAEIAAASQEQSTGIDQVNRAVTEMDQVTQANAAQTEELSSTSQSLAGQAEQLQALVGRFKLGGDAVARRPAASHRRPLPPHPPLSPAGGEEHGEGARGRVRRVDREKPVLVGAPAGNRSADAKDDGFEEF